MQAVGDSSAPTRITLVEERTTTPTTTSFKIYD